MRRATPSSSIMARPDRSWSDSLSSTARPDSSGRRPPKIVCLRMSVSDTTSCASDSVRPVSSAPRWSRSAKISRGDIFVGPHEVADRGGERCVLGNREGIDTGLVLEPGDQDREGERVETLAGKLALLLLERLGRIELTRDADEDRAGVSRQALCEMRRQCRDFKPLVHDDRAHAGAAIGAGDADAVGCGVDHAGEIAHGVVDLGGRDVLALPAEGIADAIDEMEESLVVEPHQIAGPEPGIALGENIPQDLLLGLSGVRVALEAAAALIRRADAADGFARLAAGGGDAKPLLVAQRRTAVGIELDEARRETMREQRRDPTDRARLALDVEQREIAFGRRIEFED